ncbi:hypothetical protein [Spirosoma gilvum]
MNNSLDNLYKQRNNFLVIGLTGRLGSGCTTVAKILTETNFTDCKFPIPKNRDYNSNEERKYRIVYNIMEANWTPFILIRASDIITSILLENNLTDLMNFLSNQYGKNIDVITQLFDQPHGNVKICDEYNNLHNARIELKIIDDKTANQDDLERKKELAYKFYFEGERLTKFSEALKSIFFEHLKSDEKASPYQYFGDNIRKSGNALESDTLSEDCYKIPKIINKLIKTIRNKNKKDGKNTLIVIDSIRNSLEAFFFKERYSAFYLFAINTENEHRRKRLSQYNYSELERLDQEYDANVKAHELFYKQDIKSCIQASDIYIYNPTDSSTEGDIKETMKRSLIRYLALFLQPGVITPTPEERCMQIAYTAKYNSGCISRQVGAVITDDSFSIKSIGWNNTAEGQTPCLLRNVNDLLSNSDKEAFSDYEKSGKIREVLEEAYPQTEDKKLERVQKLKGRNNSFCFKEGQNCIEGEKNQVHTRSLHAEENAMLQISKYGGEGLKGSYLFTTASPCELCSKKAYQLGIKRVYYIDPYPGIAKQQIIASGLTKHQPGLMLFSGAIGRAYHQLFEPFMAYKDELTIRLDYNYKKANDNVIRKNIIAKEEYKMKLQKQKEEIEKKLSDLD